MHFSNRTLEQAVFYMHTDGNRSMWMFFFYVSLFSHILYHISVTLNLSLYMTSCYVNLLGDAVAFIRFFYSTPHIYEVNTHVVCELHIHRHTYMDKHVHCWDTYYMPFDSFGLVFIHFTWPAMTCDRFIETAFCTKRYIYAVFDTPQSQHINYMHSHPSFYQFYDRFVFGRVLRHLCSARHL